MTSNASVDLEAPFECDTILQVRRAKLKPMSGLQIESGIDKLLCNSPIWVGKLGLDSDEHDLTFHGGVDKAVHSYCQTHYASWQKEFPTAAARFVPGGFGENLVTAHMNERNVCIGDVMAVGSEEMPLLLQVSLPRQPCYKLNHRFQLKNFAPATWRSSRTGWYYRVLREGYVQAGDEIRLVERKWPKWTIERVQEYLHRHKDNAEMNEALAGIEVLGSESRNTFKKRVSISKEVKTELDTKWIDYRVVKKKRQTSRITSFILEAVDSSTDNTPSEGSHIRIRLGNGLTRAYSITHGSGGRFELGIALNDKSRGGSRYLHETLKEGDIVQAGTATAGIARVLPNAMMASNHVFIVGGIGITAFLWLAEAMFGVNLAVQIHYAVRSEEDVPFRDRLAKFGDRLVLYDKSKGARMPVENIIKDMSWNSQLYVCGPPRLMDDALRATRDLSIPEQEVHFEAFSADVGGNSFEVVVGNKDSVMLKVKEEETLRDVLNKEFGDVVGSSCEVGNCGTCRIKVTCGEVEHRGIALTEEERKGEMLACVSRGVGKIVVEYED